MAENSKIEWTDHTFNPWMGCTKVSDGCKNCYAETLMDKRYGKVEWGPQGTRIRTSPANWRKPLAWNKQAAKEGRRFRVFCASLADVFEIKPDQPELDEWRVDLFGLIDKTPNLDWLLLTKRPENIAKVYHGWHITGIFETANWEDWPRNIWIGTSVENQEQAEARIPHLLKVPAAVRFLSMEPLLGPVDLMPWLNYVNETDDLGLAADGFSPDFNWVIVGGESGPNARPMHPEWARSLRDQCAAAGVPYFFKQWGQWAWTGDYITESLTADPLRYAFPDKTVMVKVGKHAAGRLLDGRTWDEFPTL